MDGIDGVWSQTLQSSLHFSASGVYHKPAAQGELLSGYLQTSSGPCCGRMSLIGIL